MKNGFLVYLLLIWVSNISAQEDSSIVQQIEELVIRENRLQLSAARLSRNFTVITRKDLEKLPVVNFTDALQYTPGVDLRQRGPYGVQTDISIRGGTFDQTLVLLNGIKMSDPQTGHHAAYLPLQLMHIKQIEVLKGSASRVYGPNAYSGAINIQTELPEERKAVLQAFAGDFGLIGTQIGLSLPVSDKYKQLISFGRHQSNGYQFNTDFAIQNIFYQSELDIGRDKLEFWAGFSGRAFGANGFYASPDFKDQYEEVQTGMLALSYRYTAKDFILTPRVSWRRNEDNYVFIRSNPAFFNNLHETNVLSAELNGSQVLWKGMLGFGAEHRIEQINSSNLGVHSRQNSGATIEYRIEQGRWIVSPGMYANYFSDYGLQWYPGLDVGYRIDNYGMLFYNSGRSFRIPTYTDLYYVGPGNVGNPELKPEQAWTHEMGFRFQKGVMNGQISFYYQDAQGVIDWARSNDVEPWKPENLNRLQSIGAEIGINASFEKLHPSFWIRDVQCSYHFIEASLSLSEAIISRYALEHLNNQLIFGVSHRIARQLFHSLRLRWIDRVSMEDYAVLDSRIWWNWKGKSLYLELSNLTNTRYRETNLVLMPGRWVRLGLTADIVF